MENKVKVTLKFIGSVQSTVGIESTTVEVSTDIHEAFSEIRLIVRDIAGTEVLYNALVNGQNHAIAVKQGKTLHDGDEISLLPCILGG